MQKVTRDSGANVKVLRQLELDGLITVFDILLENGRENRKVKQKIKPIGVWGHSRWGESVWADKNDPAYEQILAIVGHDNVKDAMHLEAHLRSGNDVFVTEDTDFLKNRRALEAQFACTILTPAELKDRLLKR